MEHYTLHDVLQKVKDSFINTFPLPVWVVAEISELKVNYSGHCYLELIEKDSLDGFKLKAKVNATIWANKYRLLKTYFETSTRIELTEGLKVLIKVDIRFHEIYGFSLNITDIDPAFTIGDLQLQRNLVVQRLINEGIVDLNKEIAIRLVPQRIAVISSATAAGFQDFKKHLLENDQGYIFKVDLFSAVMQGSEAEKSIVKALELIYQNNHCYDAVVIIRGGGSQTDLLCFDSYDVAANIAQFPLPVLSGIGHDKDESVVDLVAYKNFKTPTAVASFLLDLFAKFEEQVQSTVISIAQHAQLLVADSKMAIANKEYDILDIAKHIIAQEKQQLNKFSLGIMTIITDSIRNQHRQLANFGYLLDKGADRLFKLVLSLLDMAQSRMVFKVEAVLLKEKYGIELMESKVNLAKPDEILKRGYSLTLLEGKILVDPSNLEGKTVTTILRDGQFESKVLE